MVMPLLLLLVTGLAVVWLGVFFAVHGRRQDVPDAATPELAAVIDDRLHCGCPPAEPIYGCIVCGHQRCATHRDQDHGCAPMEREPELMPCRRPVVPPHIDPPYVPTAAEDAAWHDLAARLEAS